MKLIGLCPVRNEEFCLGLTLRAALLWCDEMVVLLHACTDRSAGIVADVIRENERGRIHVLRESDPLWNEMPQRQRMLYEARAYGATHIAIVDADEILTGNLAVPQIGDSGVPLRCATEMLGNAEILEDRILELPGYNLRCGLGQYHSNGIWGRRWFSVIFKDSPGLGWSGDKFHSRVPGPPGRLKPLLAVKQDVGGVMHLWGAGERRLYAKHRLYRIIERLRWPEKPVAEIEEMYSWATDGVPAACDTPAQWLFKPVPESWWAPYKPWMKYLDIDAVPWQEAEADRLIQQHGPGRFAGLRV